MRREYNRTLAPHQLDPRFEAPELKPQAIALTASPPTSCATPALPRCSWKEERRRAKRVATPAAEQRWPSASSPPLRPPNDPTTARIQALPLEQLEALAEALLDFGGPADLAVWLAEHAG